MNILVLVEREEEVGILVSPTEHRENATKTLEKASGCGHRPTQPQSIRWGDGPSRIRGPGAHRSLCGFSGPGPTSRWCRQ